MRSIFALLALLSLGWTGACASTDRASAWERQEPAPTPAEVEAARATIERKRAKWEKRGPKPFNKPERAAQFFADQRRPIGEERIPLDGAGSSTRWNRRPATVAHHEPAASWEVGGPNLSAPDSISAIGISRSDGDVVYLGYTNGYVARSTNALAGSPSWSVVSSGLPIGGWVGSVSVDPQDPDVAYATYTNYGIPHIYRTENGGASWSAIDGVSFTGVPDIPVHWLEVRPCDSSQLYVGTELGVFVSEDTGATWAPANLGLAHTVVESLDFKDRDTLVAFTHGRGAFVARLEPCPRRGYREVDRGDAAPR